MTTSKHNLRKEGAHTYSKEVSALCNHPILTREEEIELATRIQNGDEEAFHRLVECNIKLVASLCKRRIYDEGYGYEDAVSNGILGLMKAARGFDPTKGVKFATYASWAIRCAISDGQQATASPAVTIPKGAMVLLKKHNDGEPIGSRRPDTVTKIGNAVYRTKTFDADYHSPIVDEDSYEPPFYPVEVVELMQDSIKLLEDTDQQILAMRYGLPPYERAHTNAEIAKVLGISLEWARNKEANARERLKTVMKDQHSKCQGLSEDS